MSEEENTMNVNTECRKKILSVPGFDAEGLKEIKVIVGLGNPGKQYVDSRHNIGFMVLDKIVNRAALEWLQNGVAMWAYLFVEMNALSNNDLLLCKPNTFMNNSGNIAVKLRKNGVEPHQVLVVHDELEREFGYVGLRFGGSARGHNGLRSIMDKFGKDFWRMGLGIGRPEQRDDVGNYVLASFLPKEKEQLPSVLNEALSVIFP